MIPYTHIIWDFNGTILDDVQIGIDSINSLLSKRGLPTIDSVERYREVFGFPIIKYYERLGFDFSAESFDDVAVEWVNEYNSRRDRAPVQKGVEGILKNAKARGIKQTVISASERGMLCDQICELGLSEFFEELIGLDHIKATGKTHLAEEWRRRNPTAVPLFIGDTDHDVCSAKAMGCDCILVAVGHQSYEDLLGNEARVCRDMNEVCDLLFSDGT